MITFQDLGSYGRLGNMIFQISATIGLALDNNDQYLFPPWKYEKHFNLHGCFSAHIKPQTTYNEPHFHYQKIPYQKGLNLRGYFQSYKYWENHQNLIRSFFTPNINQHELVNIIGADPGNCTAVHVRRTDYLKFPDHHPVLNMDYYNQAMELAPGEKFCIFSDDPQWCRENFKGNEIQIMPTNSEIFDLAAMSRFKNNIVANSSYSWWSSFLNKNIDKKVIAPNKWFGLALAQHDTKDLYLPDWIRI